MKQNYYAKSSKRLLLSFIMALFGSMMPACAETVSANFNSGLPEGWSLEGDVANDDTRARSGNGLWTSSKSATANYVVTCPVEGTFEFYARAYNKNTASEVIVYEYTGSSFGEQLFTTGSLKTSSTPTWSKYSFNVENGTQLAIVLNYAAIDDVTYTPYVASATAELEVSGYASGSSYDFGGVPVPAGTTHSFTLKNRGLTELTISGISVTGDYTITEGASLTSIAAGSSATVTVATPAKDATGALTITSNDANSPYVINLSSTYKVPVPIMGLSTTAVKFGKVTANASQDITVSNTGDATLTAAVASDNADFTVSPASVTVAAGETGVFMITYKYNATAYGVHTANITVTPNAGDAQVVTVSAKVQDPNVWTEDFEGGALPAGWKLEGSAQWTVEKNTNDPNNATIQALSPLGSTYGSLITPRLEATAGEELTFDAFFKWGDEYLKVEYATDKTGTWTELLNYTYGGSSTVYATVPLSVTAPITGAFYLKFTARYGNSIDNLEGFRLDQNAPELAVTPAEDATFGKVTATPEARTYTVANNGTGKMTVNITSSSEDFTVTPAQLTDIENGTPQTFTVTFNFNAESLGDKSATITVTPTYNEGAAVSFNATATAKNPNLWEEDFEEGTIPSTWINGGSWTVSTPSVTGSNGTKMATISSYGTAKTLTTPRLEAKAGDKLSFYIGMQYDDEPLTIEYQQEGSDEWKTIESGVNNYTASADLTFTAPAAGYYKLRFTGTYAMLDNFSGFKLAMKEHDAVITAQSIPTTGYQYADYTATVTVKEMAGKAEELTAKFFINGTQYGEAVTENVEANGTKTFTITFTPEESTTGDAYFTITGTDIDLKSAEAEVNINAATIWKDAATDYTVEANTYESLVIQYSLAEGWNSIVLPLSTNLSAFGTDVKAFSFSGYTDGTLRFSQVTSGKLNPATPYLLYATTATDVNLSYLNQTINSGFVGAENINVKQGEATFQGSYEYVAAPALDGKYGVTREGKIVPGSNTAWMKGFHAYFVLPAGATAPTLTVDGQATGIGTFSPILGQDAESQRIYNLNGQLVKTPRKGLYIVNGRKVIKK